MRGALTPPEFGLSYLNTKVPAVPWPSTSNGAKEILPTCNSSLLPPAQRGDVEESRKLIKILQTACSDTVQFAARYLLHVRHHWWRFYLRLWGCCCCDRQAQRKSPLTNAECLGVGEQRVSPECRDFFCSQFHQRNKSCVRDWRALWKMLPQLDASMSIIHQFTFKKSCSAQQNTGVLNWVPRSFGTKGWALCVFTDRQKYLCRWSGPSLRRAAPPSGRWAASAGDATPAPLQASAGLSAAAPHAAGTHTEKKPTGTQEDYPLQLM